MRIVIAPIMCLLASATVATAATQSALRSVNGTGLSSASPGNAFTMNFAPSITKDAAPYHVLQVGMIFDSGSTQFTQLNIQLDSSPTVFTFLPYPGNHRQVAYTLYDPSFTSNPGVGYPTTPEFVLLPQAWRDDLEDGVLAGKLWVSDPVGGANTYLMSANSVFEVPETASPEPGAGLAVIATAATLLRRGGRRRR